MGRPDLDHLKRSLSPTSENWYYTKRESSFKASEEYTNATVGEKGTFVNPGQTDDRKAENSANVNENNYFVVTARHEDTGTDIARFRPITTEGW
jgi:hypothetical protein